jgi:hypothetical protein
VVEPSGLAARTADAPALCSAANEPVGYVFGSPGAQHYVGIDGHVYELWWKQTGWHVEYLTAYTGAPFVYVDAGVGYPFEPARGVPDPTPPRHRVDLGP